jgi:hypothetical protein
MLFLKWTSFLRKQNILSYLMLRLLILSLLLLIILLFICFFLVEPASSFSLWSFLSRWYSLLTRCLLSGIVGIVIIRCRSCCLLEMFMRWKHCLWSLFNFWGNLWMSSRFFSCSSQKSWYFSLLWFRRGYNSVLTLYSFVQRFRFSHLISYIDLA